MITIEKFTKLYKSDKLLREIAKELDVSAATVAKYAKKLGLSRGSGNRAKRSFDF